MRKRLIAGLFAATLVFGVVTGLAASLNVSSAKLGSGDATITACDTDGVNSTYTFTSGTSDVSAIAVSGIADPNCDGAEVRVQALNSSGTVLGHGTATNTADADTNPNSVDVALNTAVASSDIATVRVTLNGGS